MSPLLADLIHKKSLQSKVRKILDTTRYTESGFVS